MDRFIGYLDQILGDFVVSCCNILPHNASICLCIFSDITLFGSFEGGTGREKKAKAIQ